LTDPKVFSSWNALCGLLGIGLPLTFAGQVRPATTFLRPGELIPLYATEWIMLGLLGLAVSGLIAVLDRLAVKVRWSREAGLVAKVGFAVVLATSFFMGGLTWLASFRDHLPTWQSWYGLLLVVYAVTGVTVAKGWFDSTLVSAATGGRFLMLVGSVTLLSLPYVAGFHAATGAEASTLMAQPDDARPNIVLISIDALAASHLTPYGSLRPTSPNIAAFASRGIIFDAFHANANFTTSAVASILTGVLPWTHRALQLAGRPNPASVLESLPARLHKAGYLTAFFGSNPWAGARRLGFSAYFDYQDSDTDWAFGPCLDALANRFPYLCPAAGNPLINLTFATIVRGAAVFGIVRVQPHSDLERITARATRWIAGHERSPVFVWVHYFPPHDPYAAPDRWLGQFDSSAAARTATTSHPVYLFNLSLEEASRIQALEARYDESILYVDHYIGQLVTAIRQSLGRNTAILLTADHGESFDHGYGGHSGVMLYEDLIHVPLIVELPGGLESTERRDELATQIDLAPTIAAIAGVTPCPCWEGRSLLGVSSLQRTVFAMNFEQNASRGRLTTGSVAALQSNWKLVRFFGKPQYPNMPQLQTQLFNLTEDAHEHQNQAAVHPDIVAGLSAEIDAELAVHGDMESE
jgi:arylsulfatase A-like enzyme